MSVAFLYWQQLECSLASSVVAAVGRSGDEWQAETAVASFGMVVGND